VGIQACEHSDKFEPQKTYYGKDYQWNPKQLGGHPPGELSQEQFDKE
jgi:hypothetical protein